MTNNALTYYCLISKNNISKDLTYQK